MVGTVKFEARIKELVEKVTDLAMLVEPLLMVRRVLREQVNILHRRLLAVVRDDDVCRRLMTVPGVGPVVALTYRATIDVPARFQELQGGRSGAWVDALQVSVGRDRPNRRDITVWRRDDASGSLRGGPTQGVGDEDRQEPWDEKGDCGPGTPLGRDHASNMG